MCIVVVALRQPSEMDVGLCCRRARRGEGRPLRLRRPAAVGNAAAAVVHVPRGALVDAQAASVEAGEAPRAAGGLALGARRPLRRVAVLRVERVRACAKWGLSGVSLRWHQAHPTE